VSTESVPEIPVIVGPTAAGKTALSLMLAEAFPGTEIVSADSRQIYIGMDIGTAKPARAELDRVPHHLIDIVAPDTPYSAGRYADAARAVIVGILERGGRPLVVGGSGFYVKALFEGLGAPAADPVILDRLQRRGEEEGFDLLYDELAAIDPETARRHSPNNHAKTLRALCCYYQTGRLYSSFLEGETESAPLRPVYLGIAPAREVLYRRIDRRVLGMLEDGLVDETRRLLATGYGRDAPGMRTVGYAEVLARLAGEIDAARMVELIQQATRRYAKRQMTWFRRVQDVLWMPEPDIGAALERIGWR